MVNDADVIQPDDASGSLDAQGSGAKGLDAQDAGAQDAGAQDARAKDAGAQDLDAQVEEWWAVPDIVERTGVRLTEVKRWLQEREVVGVRRGPNNAVMVPASFFDDEGPLHPLRGTITVLADNGLTDPEIIEWLHEADDTLQGGSAIASLRSGNKTEVRRRAQEQAF
ncbi:Rv2175c family DNA-binding protein [Ornithinimicrobium sp. Y1847]|uniref:Rv2175c family DNA-binding protein n=1 Tax=unclassified Ornithinimicrobium TaxID=2615080 RepID=UPI003B684489